MENVATEEFISRTDTLKDFEECNKANQNWTPQRVKTLLLRQPTADVAEVVRCKDCKHSCKDGTGRTCEGYWYELSEFAVSVEDDDFCSYGEQKDGGADNG